VNVLVLCDLLDLVITVLQIFFRECTKKTKLENRSIWYNYDTEVIAYEFTEYSSSDFVTCSC